MAMLDLKDSERGIRFMQRMLSVVATCTASGGAAKRSAS
jgi:hypothetical protein